MATSNSIRAPRATKPSPLNIDQEVTAMRQMTPKELREKYAEVFGEQTRSGNKQWLIKRIAWRMQANVEGGLSERARQRALEIANDADLRLKAPSKKPDAAEPSFTHDPRVPLPGFELNRIYKGRRVKVTVKCDGFEYEGVTYKSLSAVAKAITGTHTNGFLFFRLNGKGGRK